MSTTLIRLAVIVLADAWLRVIRKFVYARLKYWSKFVRQR